MNPFKTLDQARTDYRAYVESFQRFKNPLIKQFVQERSEDTTGYWGGGVVGRDKGIADWRLPIADCGGEIADLRLPIADCGWDSADCQLPIADLSQTEQQNRSKIGNDK